MTPIGPPNSPIAIVLDFPSRSDLLSKEPLSDYAGKLFWDEAAKFGIYRNQTYVTYLVDKPPPEDDIEFLISKRKTCPGVDWRHVNGSWVKDEVAEGVARVTRELAEVQPQLVITLGGGGLWALQGTLAVLKWRGSRLSPPQWPFTIVPLLPPRTLSQNPETRHLFQIDLARVKAIYEGTQTPRVYRFIVKPEFDQVIKTLSNLFDMAEGAKREGRKLRLAGDLETRAGNIACMGIAWSPEDAICIPHITTNDEKPFYWEEGEETEILSWYYSLFQHEGIIWIGQNWSYDCQYFHRHWGVIPLNSRDTMIGHHSIFVNMRKGLDFLSAMYAQDHIYWKDEIKEWDIKVGEVQYWTYNCKDACITWEIWPEIQQSAIDKGMEAHFAFKQSLFYPVLRMMNRGIRLDTGARSVLKIELTNAAVNRKSQLNYLVGHELDPKSPAQLVKFFYNDMGIPGIKNLITDNLTTNSTAIIMISEREPLLQPLCKLILELRSLNVFISTFINARLDTDHRMRCSFGIASTETDRFNSSTNAFNSGMNLQNIPVEEKQKIKDKDYIHLPNIRKLFIPDENYTYFDIDLDRADLQVVVYEADDKDMKLALRAGLDMHCVNACDVFDIPGIPYDELNESHRNYREHRARIGEAARQKTKAGVHATNYGVGDNKLAQTLGISRDEAARFRTRWFGAHPGIRKWHLRTEELAAKRGYIENKFGCRIYVLGRINLPELLGWLPQSTVAGVINRALIAIDAEEQAGKTSIQLQIQVHDSLAGQFLTSRAEEEVARLKRLAAIVVPYDDPLVIPIGVKTSTKSWGDCK